MITLNWIQIIAIIVIFIIFIAIFRTLTIIKTVLYLYSDLIDHVPERYVELDLDLVKSIVTEFIEDDEASTIDIQANIVTANTELFGTELNKLLETYNIKFEISDDIQSMTTVIRLTKEESEDNKNNQENEQI